MRTLALHTPWGVADTIETIGDGVQFVSTPSHGGFYLEPEQVRRVWSVARKFPGWKGSPRRRFYEEDCEAAMVVLAFPDYFAPSTVELAQRAADRWYGVSR